MAGNAMGQTNQIDSVRNLIQNTSQDTIRMRLNFQLAQLFLKNGEPDSQLIYAEAALQLSEKVKELSSDQQRIRAGALRIAGIYYRYRGDYSKATGYYIEALKGFEEVNDSNGIASTNNSIGIAYLNMERYQEAFAYFYRAYRIDSMLHRTEKQVADLTNMVNALRQSGNQSDSIKQVALAYSMKALQLAKAGADTALLVSANETAGMVLRDLNRSKEALPYSMEALRLSEKLGQPFLLAEQQYQLAELYNNMQQYDQAVAVCKDAESIMEANNFSNIRDEVYSILMKAYEGNGNFEEAYRYSLKLQAFNDSTYQTEIAEQLKQFESERKDNEIALLKSNNEIATTKLQRNQTAVIGFAVLFILLSVLTWIIQRNRQQKIRNIKKLEALNLQLEQQKEEISSMNTLLQLKALRAQMNPHFIFNCMSSIQECMLTGRLDAANAYLTKLSKLLRMVLLHADDESVSLEKELQMLRLYLDLESLRLKDGFRYEIHVDEEIFPEEVQVPTLILQPFAENAIWHGLLNKPSDRELKITIAASDDTLDCVVEDNGIGREKAHERESGSQKHQSKGMELIGRRLDILRSKSQQAKTGFTITDKKNGSSESAGTRVDIILPLLAS
jgi:tetratricopeptide (TPR) repeat protein/anti-sigma regulatory factor (Ser/Thr protein kinase)